jgi:hypothetical protein
MAYGLHASAVGAPASLESFPHKLEVEASGPAQCGGVIHGAITDATGMCPQRRRDGSTSVGYLG